MRIGNSSDQLLVRTPQGMAPTPRALALGGPLHEVLEQTGGLLAGPASFDPATARRRFVLAATDYVQYVVLGNLAHRIQQQAPGIALEVVPCVQSYPWHDLEGGSVDLILGAATRNPPRGLHRRWLFRDRVVCVLRNDHPYASGQLTLKRYLELAHVEALPLSGVGLADRVLAALGQARRIAVTVPHFLVAPYLVVQTDCCFTLAYRIARPMAELLPLCVRSLPFEMPGITVGAYWHQRVHDDPAHRWLRRLVAEVAATMDRGQAP